MENDSKVGFDVLNDPDIHKAIIALTKKCKENCNYNPIFPNIAIISGVPTCYIGERNNCYFSPIKNDSED